MSSVVNEFGQVVGVSVVDWGGAESPSNAPMVGRYCRIEALDAFAHLDDLYEAFAEDREGSLWTYMAVGPFESKDEFRAWLEASCTTDDPLYFAILDLATAKAVGVAAYLRIKPSSGVIEVGSISYSPRLQRTRVATETMFLMMQRVFDEHGYRRYEWKCDSLNVSSRKAADRLGFSFDGLFAQSLVYKGRNRDTAWYSIIDREWPALKRAYTKWLDPDNFDAQEKQQQKLQHFISR